MNPPIEKLRRQRGAWRRSRHRSGLGTRTHGLSFLTSMTPSAQITDSPTTYVLEDPWFNRADIYSCL